MHWYTLPKWIRDLIWKHYCPGQENDKNPSREYIAAAEKANLWASGYESGKGK